MYRGRRRIGQKGRVRVPDKVFAKKGELFKQEDNTQSRTSLNWRGGGGALHVGGGVVKYNPSG